MAKRDNLICERWPKERVTKMLLLVKAGMNFGQIATELGVSRMAAYSKYYNMESGNTPEKLDNRNRQVIERTGKFWRLGCANPRENALQMRKDYLRMTARLMHIHGPNCFARFNLEIPRG